MRQIRAGRNHDVEWTLAREPDATIVDREPAARSREAARCRIYQTVVFEIVREKTDLDQGSFIPKHDPLVGALGTWLEIDRSLPAANLILDLKPTGEASRRRKRRDVVRRRNPNVRLEHRGLNPDHGVGPILTSAGAQPGPLPNPVHPVRRRKPRQLIHTGTVDMEVHGLRVDTDLPAKRRVNSCSEL